jgi:hypothetical protein
MRTVFDFVAKRAELSPNATAFEDAGLGRRITLADFNQRAERGTAVLEWLGVAAGKHVAPVSQLRGVFRAVVRLRQARCHLGSADPRRAGGVCYCTMCWVCHCQSAAATRAVPMGR